MIAQDLRLINLVRTLEATAPMPDTYIAGVHDVYIWCRQHLTGQPLIDATNAINAAYGATYTPTTPYLVQPL